ncbi:unnamed protein product [Camellia sinensis]
MALEESSLSPSGSTKKSLYMFFMHSLGPIQYSLYTINMPNPLLPLPPLQPPSNHQSTELESEKTIIHLILEFPVGQYPEFICHVELDMKLYFFGGQLRSSQQQPSKGNKDWDLNDTYPPNVHVLDTITITIATSNHPSELLTKGTAMINGKPNPFAFVAYKIYAFATSMPFNYKLMNLSRFEVFDLDSNKWSILPDPPMKKKLTGHALVDTRVFIRTWDNEILFQCGHVSAEFVEDTLYSIYYDYTRCIWADFNGDRTFFREKLLYTAQFVARSKCGAFADAGFLLGCFSFFTE